MNLGDISYSWVSMAVLSFYLSVCVYGEPLYRDMGPLAAADHSDFYGTNGLSHSDGPLFGSEGQLRPFDGQGKLVCKGHNRNNCFLTCHLGCSLWTANERSYT